MGRPTPDSARFRWEIASDLGIPQATGARLHAGRARQRHGAHLELGQGPRHDREGVANGFSPSFAAA